MAKEGLGFFYNKLGLSIEDLGLYYNFNNSSGAVPVVSGSNSLSGEINGNPNFWDISGSGYLNGYGIDVQNFSGFSETDWSVVFVFEKTGIGSECLFSTLDSGVNSGISVSVNDLNDLVISAKDSNGYVLSESFDLPLSNKNILSIVKAGNNISSFLFDPSSLSYYSDSKSFPPSCNLNGDLLSIGKTSLSGFSNFGGYVDEFLLLSSVINGKQFQTLSSGFLRDAYNISYVEESGFSFGVAYCNDAEYISGLNPSIVYRAVETPSEIDIGFLSTFQKSGLKHLGCSNNLFYTVSVETGVNVLFNERIFFDLVNGYFKTYNNYNFGDTIFFYNGLLQNKTSDYSYSSKLLIKSGSSMSSTGVLDVISHSYSIDSIVSGDLASGQIFSSSSPNSLIFFNGEVLISGLDYDLSSSGFRSISNRLSSSSGELTKIVISGLDIKTDFVSGNFLETNFFDDSIAAFIDRRRLPISEFSQLSSVELGYSSTLTPCFTMEAIYENEGTYINE